jgi:hypothetical protein
MKVRTRMTRTLRILTSAAGTLAVLAAAACASFAVNSYTVRGVDFSQYRTYNWAADDQLVTGDPRLDNNPFFLDRLHRDVERHLATRKLEKSTSGTPDLRIHFHASVSDHMQLGEAEPVPAFCNGCLPYVYQAGTLVLDLVDVRSEQLIWRGWAAGSIEGIVDDQRTMERAIDEAVARILERLPNPER